jgi:hypothetical protein
VVLFHGLPPHAHKGSDVVRVVTQSAGEAKHAQFCPSLGNIETTVTVTTAAVVIVVVAVATNTAAVAAIEVIEIIVNFA